MHRCWCWKALAGAVTQAVHDHELILSCFVPWERKRVAHHSSGTKSKHLREVEKGAQGSQPTLTTAEQVAVKKPLMDRGTD